VSGNVLGDKDRALSSSCSSRRLLLTELVRGGSGCW
jgi:hypothetical protein